MNLFSPFGLWAVSAESAPPSFSLFLTSFSFGRSSRKYSSTPFFHKLMTHFVPRRETNNTTTTKREKEEVITARVSFPSVPLERKWWCEYSSLSLYENARFFREIYFFSSFSHPRKESFSRKKKKEKKKKEKKERNNFFSREKDTRKNTKRKKNRS